MSDLPIRLYMIPGTGTDARMFIPQKEAFPGMFIPEWLPPLHLKESLESYSTRLAKMIDTQQPFVLGGVSLGGMIAQEMALSLLPKALILIATCRSYKAMPLIKRIMGKLTRACPDFIIKGLFGLLAKTVLATKSRRKHQYADMLITMSANLVRWQSGAATEWELKGRLTMPIFHIHGGKDTIIPVKNVNPQKIIEEGGHLINATHEHEVNDFIEESIAKIMEQSASPAIAKVG